MKKNSFLNIENIKNDYKGNLPLISHREKGEFEIYKNLISQKKNNKKELSLKTYILNRLKVIEFTNFGFSSDGNILGFIYDKKYLVIYDKLKKSIEYLTSLPEKITNNIDDFISVDNRSFFKKIITRLSFDEIFYKSNNLFVSDTGDQVLIASNDRKTYFYFTVKNSSPSWFCINLSNFLINLNEAIVQDEIAKNDFINRIENQEILKDINIGNSKSGRKNIIILEFIKGILESKIKLDFKTNFFVDFQFIGHNKIIDRSNTYKDYSLSCPNEDYNNLIKSNFSGIKLNNFSIENYNNLFYSYIDSNIYNNSNQQQKIENIQIENKKNNRENKNSQNKNLNFNNNTCNNLPNISYQFSTRLLSKLNKFLSYEYIKNSSTIANNESVKNKIKKNSYMEFLISSNLINHTDKCANSNTHLSNLKNINDFAYNLNTERNSDFLKEKQILEISFTFLILLKCSKNNLNDNFILNLKSNLHLEKEEFIYMDHFLIRDKNCDFINKLKLNKNIEHYFLEYNNKLNISNIISLDYSAQYLNTILIAQGKENENNIENFKKSRSKSNNSNTRTIQILNNIDNKSIEEKFSKFKIIFYLFFK